MQVFVINLEGAHDRWASIEETFRGSGCEVVRVPAVPGLQITLPHPGFDERGFQRVHGRSTNLRELGCYLSHVEASRRFLETSEPFALICEDDVKMVADFPPLLTALTECQGSWDLVRMSAIGTGHPVKARTLTGGYDLMVNLSRLKGTGAYLVNRRAAQAISDYFLPMILPFDHAADREWVYGLRGFSVLPIPISQTQAGFRSSIQKGPSSKLAPWRRWLTTYPYQVVNEVSRYVMRSISLLQAWLGR